MSKQAAFAGQHTMEKLDALAKYLASYQRALSRQDFQTVYFDAFAGTGELPIARTAAPLLSEPIDKFVFAEGSAQRALTTSPPFDRYVFVELGQGRVDELLSVKQDFPALANRIEIIRSDANSAMLAFCRETNWSTTRAVVFLDPYGNQVSFDTLRAISNCNIDLWYLFPAQLGVARQISSRGEVTPEAAASIDRLYGASDWRDKFIGKAASPDLFGDREAITKTVGPNEATRYMIERMQETFDGGVLDEWLPLGRNGAHWYSLIFACANRSKRAREIATRIARAVMKRKSHGRRI